LTCHGSGEGRRGNPYSLTFPQPFYQAKVAGHHRRDEMRCMPQKTRIGPCAFLDSNAQMDGRPGKREQQEKEETNLLLG